MALLGEQGNELPRPAADYLDEGIYELRARVGKVQYRVLYFFHGARRAVLAHAITKTDKIPPPEMERAKRRRKAFERDPQEHTYEE